MTEERKKEEGMDQAAQRNAELLKIARRTAIKYAVEHIGYCSIEDVREALAADGISLDFGPWSGSVFMNDQWEYDSTIRARHKGSHARRVSLWRLKDWASRRRRAKPEQIKRAALAELF